MRQDPPEPAVGQVGLPGSNDPAALWDSFAPPLRAFLARRVPAGVEPDDLLQDVFLRVVKHLDSLRSTERPEAWLFQIARNALRDALRARQRKDGRTDPLDVDLPAETDTAAPARLRIGTRAVFDANDRTPGGAVPDGHRTTSLRGLTQAEAARHVGVRCRV